MGPGEGVGGRAEGRRGPGGVCGAAGAVRGAGRARRVQGQRVGLLACGTPTTPHGV